MTRSLVLCLFVFSTPVFGQDTVVEGWQKKLESFYSSTPPVVVHLFFNQPMYARGDTAFFRAAFVTAEEMLPIKGSQILMLDLINHKGEITLHQEFRVKNGWDGNQVIIPADIAPGKYRVKAYCDWMRNFSYSLFFTGVIEIAGEHNVESVPAKVELEYFAEGGKLIGGLKNKVVVLSSPNAGKGTVTDEKGNYVTDFNIGNYGYGFFYITPENDKRYRAGLGQHVVNLAPAESDGVAILLTSNTEKNTMHRLILQASAQSLLRKESVYLLVSGHGAIYYSALVQFGDLEYVTVNVPTEELPPGLSLLTLLRNNGDVLVSRMLYTRKDNAIQLNISLLKPEAVTREEVKCSVSVHDKTGKPILSQMSVTVYNDDLFTETVTGNNKIQDYLWGTCNVAIDDSQPSPNSDSPEADLFLISQAWPWYTWKQLLTTPEEPRHFFEGYQHLNGRISGALSQDGVTDKTNLTFYLQSTDDVYEFEANQQGDFTGTLLFDFYDQEEIFYRAERYGKKLMNTSITLSEDKISYSAVAPGISTSKINPYFNYAGQKNLVTNSYQFFDRMNSDLITKKAGPNASMEDELWGAEFEIDLDDFTIFPTMQETVHEIIPWLQNRKHNGKDVLRMYLPDRKTNGEESPTFLIDGVLTDDSDYFLNLKPVNVDKIKLITKGDKLSKLSALGKNGLVLVETKIPGNAAKVSRNGSYFLAPGLTKPIAFSSALKSWQAKTNRVPRMQSTLFWNPNLATTLEGEASFSFLATDDTGQFRVIIEGLTFDGRPFRAEETFRVNFGKNSN